MQQEEIFPVGVITVFGIAMLIVGAFSFQYPFSSPINIFSVGVGILLTNIGILYFIKAGEHVRSIRTVLKSMKFSVLVLTLILIIVQSAIVLGVLTSSTVMSSTGLIRTVGIGTYLDSGCLKEASSVNWGTLEPGASTESIIYIKNEGNTQVTLSLATENWNPGAASTHITLGWNYYEQYLEPGQVIQTTLTLQVLESITGITGFSFDIEIAAHAVNS